jgi:hypothetical protein
LRFWDASAIVPLLVAEPATQILHRLLGQDAEMVVWWGTLVECSSAIARVERESGVAMDVARSLLESLSRSFLEVQPTERVRGEATRLPRIHPLRAADSLQLSAALAWRENDPAGAELVCLDERLRGAASTCGFAVRP